VWTWSGRATDDGVTICLRAFVGAEVVTRRGGRKKKERIKRAGREKQRKKEKKRKEKMAAAEEFPTPSLDLCATCTAKAGSLRLFIRRLSP
jgi:hypothetical protein